MVALPYFYQGNPVNIRTQWNEPFGKLLHNNQHWNSLRLQNSLISSNNKAERKLLGYECPVLNDEKVKINLST